MEGQVRINPDRFRKSMEAMATIGAVPGGGVTRLALSEDDRRARDSFAGWLRDGGLQVDVDDMGNVYGRREGSEDAGPAVLLGSHLDTVTGGGRFDGVAGVLAALEVIRTLNDHGIRTRLPVEVVNWTNEEGVRFHPAMMGSGVIAGKIAREAAYATTDRDGVSFRSALEGIGYLGTPENRRTRLRAYLELHIEQGPILERRGAAIGVVEGIQGISWFTGRVAGRASHAGTTPMSERLDALGAFAEIVRDVQRLPSEVGEPLVATVGSCSVVPNDVNVVPGEVSYTVDVRAPRAEAIRRAEELLRAGLRRLASDGFDVSLEEIWHSEPTAFDGHLVDLLEQIAEARGLSNLRLYSGAGHDAKYMADIAPTAMIFVPSAQGLSHSAKEHTDWELLANGVQVLCDMVMRLAEAPG